ncbi:efflux RND transporter periplasmic adaptor subunit [Paludibaculum fermentans]|uniref:efflux RND transporter periplasmic adaptor subunit n=1 Tax=Paludibaculum fermentans TaxID=1473598 RepID=UPI003EC05FF9
MTTKTSLQISFAAALALTCVISGCNAAGSGAATEAAGQQSPVPQDPLSVRVSPALRTQLRVGQPAWENVRGSLSVAGRVEADETRLSRAGSPVAGRITALEAVEGQRVTRGQVLAILNSTDLADGQFGFLRAQSQELLAQRALVRARQLVDAGVIGVAESQRREAEHAQYSVEFATWRDRLRVMGMPPDAIAALERTRTVNSLSQVVANIEGVILERKVTTGQIVQPADTLFVIADLSQVWLVADVPEQAAGLIQAGKALEGDIPALPGSTVRGQLSFVSAIVSPETRTVRVRMDLPNPGLLYKPAMLANIRLQDRPERKLVVPATAVVREGNQDYIFLETKADEFLMKPVLLSDELRDKRVVAEGVEPAQRIVLDGAFHLNNERKRASLHGE